MLTRIEVCTLLEEVITCTVVVKGDACPVLRRAGVPYRTALDKSRQLLHGVTRPGPTGSRAAAPRAARGGRPATSFDDVAHLLPVRFASRGIASPTGTTCTTTSIHAATTLEPRDTRRHHTRHCADAPCMSCSLRRNIPGTPAARAAERVTRTIHKVTTHEVTTRESRRPCGASDRSITVASSCPAQLP